MISRKTLRGKFCATSLAAVAMMIAPVLSAADSAVQLRISGTGAPELSWNSQTGAVYRIQGSTSLSPTAVWETLEPVVAESNLARWKAPELNAPSDARFFRLLLPEPEVFSVEPARFPFGGPTEMYITGQCFGPGIEVRVGSETLEHEIVHPGLIRATFVPQVPGSYEFELVRAGSVLSSFAVHCYDASAPAPSVLQAPPDEPLASPVSKNAGEKGIGINVGLAPDWSLGGAQSLKVKEKATAPNAAATCE